jgi:hypothetical protein
MSIIRVAIPFLLVASSAYVVVSAVRGPGVAPGVTVPHRQFVRSELTARTDQEQLRSYFLWGLPDAARRPLP